MTDSQILEITIAEVETKSFGVTEQFLEIHKIAYADNKPVVARVDTEKENVAIVYFKIEDQPFFLAIGVELKPFLSVIWVNIEPFHSVYFSASSDKLSLEELGQLTKLKPTGGRNKGDKKRPGANSEIAWKESTIFFEPDPGADEFEDKLTKLLDFLEQDKAGVERLVEKGDGYIQVCSSFHNGNTMLGGHHVSKEQIRRMSMLNLAIDFDCSADGKFFKS